MAEKKSTVEKCATGAKDALFILANGGSCLLANLAFERHAGCKLNYSSKHDLKKLLNFYANNGAKS